MPRGPRLDTFGALHHVMARGIERCPIFVSEADREDFIQRIALIAPDTGTSIFAWSLMPNHFHLLLRSGKAGLSTFMRRIQTGYAGAFNRRHKRSGHLFQNRYKSVLVEEEPYFLELVRYLHLNPVRAGLVRALRELDTYPWSGHAVLLGHREAAWQDVGYVFGVFHSDMVTARRAYRTFVTEGISQGHRPELSGGGLIRSIGGWEQLADFQRGRERWMSDERVLGSGAFVKHLQEEIESTGAEQRRIPTKDRERFLGRLAGCIGKEFGLRVEELLGGSRRREVVKARYALAAVSLAAGIRGSAVAGFMKVKLQSILRGVEPGKVLLKKRGLDMDQLLKQCE